MILSDFPFFLPHAARHKDRFSRKRVPVHRKDIIYDGITRPRASSSSSSSSSYGRRNDDENKMREEERVRVAFLFVLVFKPCASLPLVCARKRLRGVRLGNKRLPCALAIRESCTGVHLNHSFTSATCGGTYVEDVAPTRARRANCVISSRVKLSAPFAPLRSSLERVSEIRCVESTGLTRR